MYGLQFFSICRLFLLCRLLFFDVQKFFVWSINTHLSEMSVHVLCLLPNGMCFYYCIVRVLYILYILILFSVLVGIVMVDQKIKYVLKGYMVGFLS
jgi:hypothetical protein